MKICLLIIFLLFYINKVNSYYSIYNYENRNCRWYEIFCPICQSKNCAECKIYDFGLGGIYCETCKSNYYRHSSNKFCFQGNQDNYQTESNNIYYQSENDIICHPYCQECNSSITSVSMNCISCKKNFFKINGTNNCYDTFLLNESYYLKDNLFYKCDETCLTCSDGKNKTSSNCLSCDNINKSLYLLEDKNNCEFSNFSGYYLNKTSNILKKCHNSCKTCNGPYEISTDTNIENHNCIECADNYYKLPNGSYKNNCYDNNIWNSAFHSQLISLKEFKSQINDNLKAFMNSSSLINGLDFKALILTSDDFNQENQFKMGISAIDLGNCIQTMKQSYNIPEDEELIIVNIEPKKNQSNKDIEKDINDNSFDLEKNNQIKVFEFSGRELNLSVCKEGIKIMKNISDVEGINVQSVINLAQKGVDVFNANDDYFNDICHENIDGKDIIIKDRRNDIYKNVSFCQKGCKYNGIDIQLLTANCICNSSFLQSDTDYNNTNDANSKEEELNFKKLKESFISNLFDFNIDVIYCYNLVFNLKLLKSNIGFFCMIILLLLQILFFIIYLVKKLKSLRSFMLIFYKNYIKAKKELKSFPPFKKKDNFIKTSINKHNKNDKVKVKFINNKNSSNSKSLCPNTNSNKNKIITKKENLIITNNFVPTINLQTPMININNNKIISNSKRRKKNAKNKLLEKDEFYNMKSYSKMLKIKNDTLKFDLSGMKVKNSSIKNKLVNNQETLGNTNKNNNYDIIKLSRGDEDLLDMDYEQAILYDKRTYLKMFWGILVENQIILGTFFTENYLHLFVIKLSFLVFNFQISLFLNAFFYTDEYISDAYHNDGVLDFFTSLPKSIYSSLVTLVVTNLLRMLSNSKNELTRIIRDKRNDNNYIFFVDNKLRKLKNKLIAYFVLVFLFDLFFLYYVSAFCAVYHYSQKYWFFGFLESFGLDCLVTIFICIFISLFRYIAINKKVKGFYIIANIINSLF